MDTFDLIFQAVESLTVSNASSDDHKNAPKAFDVADYVDEGSLLMHFFHEFEMFQSLNALSQSKSDDSIMSLGNNTELRSAAAVSNDSIDSITPSGANWETFFHAFEEFQATNLSSTISQESVASIASVRTLLNLNENDEKGSEVVRNLISAAEEAFHICPCVSEADIPAYARPNPHIYSSNKHDYGYGHYDEVGGEAAIVF
jgi:hypothetical protein